MPISIEQIQVGHLYETPNNQQRVVLGWDAQGKVIYASRGGNVLNEFKRRYACSPATFAGACSLDLGPLKAEKLKEIIAKVHAEDILV